MTTVPNMESAALAEAAEEVLSLWEHGLITGSDIFGMSMNIESFRKLRRALDDVHRRAYPQVSAGHVQVKKENRL